jgi:hypothetical protein
MTAKNNLALQSSQDKPSLSSVLQPQPLTVKHYISGAAVLIPSSCQIFQVRCVHIFMKNAFTVSLKGYNIQKHYCT